MKVSLFPSAFAIKPERDLDIEEFLQAIKSGKWRKPVEKYRETKNKKLKASLPAVTISATMKSRDGKVPVEQRIKNHSGLICIDVDAKDNPKMSTQYAIDPECFAQFISCSGEGLKIIYKCKQTSDPSEHWRIFDAIEKRLQNKNLKLKVDSIVKSIASLQYVSYDPDPYFNFKTRLVIQPEKIQKKKQSAPKAKPSLQVNTELKKLEELVKQLGKKDITDSYENWNNIAMGLTYSLGEAGRAIYHALSKNYKGYSPSETDEQYSYYLQRQETLKQENPVTISTVYDLITGALGKAQVKKMHVAMGRKLEEAEDFKESSPDLAGMVKHKLWLFKKSMRDGEVAGLQPATLNPIEFQKLLNAKGYYRYGKGYVKVVENVVEIVDIHTILWDVSQHVQAEGDYEFAYQGEVYFFGWEDLLYLWMSIKGKSNIHISIPSSLVFWAPLVLSDTATESYIPYQNGVVKVNAKKVELLDYKDIPRPVWKERILPRPYVATKKVGMFEEFFANICGRGSKPLESEEFSRAIWYFGYMLHSYRDPAMTRAWMLYDITAGNNGGSGKSIIGEALGKIRSVAVIDGKQPKLMENRFWLQKVKEWTNIIFIDDPDKRVSLGPLFNMISGLVQPERKGQDPIEMFAKFLFASNFILEAEGSSETRRQFVTQVSNFYTRYAQEHKNILKPIVHYHGKRFFTEWDANDWASFDWFAIKCLQSHLRDPAPEDVIIGGSRRMRFIQENNEELFHDLVNIFKKEFDRQDQSIARDLLVSVIKDSNTTYSNQLSGKIARFFIESIGGGKAKVSTKSIGNRIVNVYRIDVPYAELQFEELAIGGKGSAKGTGGTRGNKSKQGETRSNKTKKKK